MPNTSGLTTRVDTPKITDERETVVVFVDDNIDSFGRRQFTAFWLADNIGPRCDEYGVRGQVFHTNVDEFAERNRKRGRTVRFVESAAGAR